MTSHSHTELRRARRGISRGRRLAPVKKTLGCLYPMPGLESWMPVTVRHGRPLCWHRQSPSATPTGDVGLSSGLLVSTWLSPGCCRHFMSPTTDRRSLLFCL